MSLVAGFSLANPSWNTTFELKAEKDLRPQDEQASLVQSCLYLVLKAHSPAHRLTSGRGKETMRPTATWATEAAL